MRRTLIRLSVALGMAVAPIGLLTSTAQAGAGCQWSFPGGETWDFEDGDEIYEGQEGGWYVYRCYDGVWVFEGYEAY